ncbi:hypothetical protein MRB53_012181 [Persea americana]|uniref:Uncharacterized protein n=1 Tax=Persea americana TaxID=3435 RepID=A0ACC2LWV2_PERAE|nr:hypothetical protein MRB53_012181 [Persea americana]
MSQELAEVKYQIERDYLSQKLKDVFAEENSKKPADRRARERPRGDFLKDIFLGFLPWERLSSAGRKAVLVWSS